MIGNDIVDLALAQKESNWQRKGFLEKLFTDYEQSVILTAANSEVMVWNLWSRKEAAYKIYNRMSGRRVFNPKAFECVADKVCFHNTIFYTQTNITSEYVYTIASTSEALLTSMQHQNSRENIHRINDLPEWFDVKSNLFFPASITHHGRFERSIYIEM